MNKFAVEYVHGNDLRIMVVEAPRQTDARREAENVLFRMYRVAFDTKAPVTMYVRRVRLRVTSEDLAKATHHLQVGPGTHPLIPNLREVSPAHWECYEASQDNGVTWVPYAQWSLWSFLGQPERAPTPYMWRWSLTEAQSMAHRDRERLLDHQFLNHPQPVGIPVKGELLIHNDLSVIPRDRWCYYEASRDNGVTWFPYPEWGQWPFLQPKMWRWCQAEVDRISKDEDDTNRAEILTGYVRHHKCSPPDGYPR